MHEGAAKAKAGHTGGRPLTKRPSSTTKLLDPDLVLGHAEPSTRANSDGEVGVEIENDNDNQEMYLNAKELVEDDGPHADVDTALANEDCNDIVDCL